MRRPFGMVRSSKQAFNSTLGSTQRRYALESSDRFWSQPSNRSIRMFSTEAFQFEVGDGSAFVTSNNSVLVRANWPTVYHITPNRTHISVESSTDATINISLGYWG